MNIRNLSYYLILILGLVSCKGEDSPVYEEDISMKDVVLGEDLIRIGMPDKLDYLIENLVSSDDIIGAIANIDKMQLGTLLPLLNPSEYVKYYSTSRTKAVNMGVYGADLNYLIHSGQTQQSMLYMLASKELADQIGVAMAFDQRAVEEYQTNVENKDSLINIIFVVYDNARRMLKNDEQFMLSSLVIAGSWIENMYLTTTYMVKDERSLKDTKLYQEVVNQKEYLEKIIECIVLLDEGDNIFINDLIHDLHSIEAIYDKMDVDSLDIDEFKHLQSQLSIVRKRMVSVN